METEASDGTCNVTVDKAIAAWCWTVIKRRFSPDHVFFEEGDRYLKLASRYLPVDVPGDLENENEKKREFPCGHARCSQCFDSLAKYEAHYNLSHRNVCSTCHRIVPSAHLLDIHILESHDVMFSLLARRIKMFQCLIEGCEEKFQDGKERHSHLIKYHRYPANYRYRQSNEGKSKKASKSSSQRNGMEVDSMETNQEPKLVKKKPRVPTNICFGQGIGRGFQRERTKPKKHWHNQNKGTKKTTVDIEAVDMKDMSVALTDI